MMKQLFYIAVLPLAAWQLALAQTDSGITRQGAYWVRTLQGSFDVPAGNGLRVQTTGNVTLRGASGDQATYTLVVRVKAGDAAEAEAILNRVNVKTGNEGGWTYVRVAPPHAGSSGADLTVNGPKSVRAVLAETAGGNVQASDFDGDVEARSAGGRIAMDRVRGRGDLRTAGGNIDVGAVNGSLRCSSGGGDVRVENAGAAANLETAGGEIVIHEARGPLQAFTGGGNIRVERAAASVVARTAGGLIQVEQAEGPVTAESSGGAIQVNSAHGVRCESAGGAIRLHNVAGAVRAFANSGSILAELARGALADSVLSTNAGDITVVIPSNLALTIEAINETGGAGRINSDFPQIRTRANGGADGPMVAQGALNGGGPMLRVNVVGGAIYLRREK
jgi:hypothetical protein